MVPVTSGVVGKASFRRWIFGNPTNCTHCIRRRYVLEFVLFQQCSSLFVLNRGRVRVTVDNFILVIRKLCPDSDYVVALFEALALKAWVDAPKGDWKTTDQWYGDTVRHMKFGGPYSDPSAGPTVWNILVDDSEVETMRLTSRAMLVVAEPRLNVLATWQNVM